MNPVEVLLQLAQKPGGLAWEDMPQVMALLKALGEDVKVNQEEVRSYYANVDDDFYVPRLPREMYVPKAPRNLYLGDVKVWRRLVGLR